MVGRYYLPLTISFVLIYIIVLQNTVRRQVIPLLITILYIGFSFIHDTLPQAQEYALRDKEDSAMMDFIKSDIPAGSVIILDHVDIERRNSIRSYLTYEHYECDLFGIDGDSEVGFPIGNCVSEAPSGNWQSDYVISQTPYETIHENFIESYHGIKWFIYQNISH